MSTQGSDANLKLETALRERFGTVFEQPTNIVGGDLLARLALHRSHRSFASSPVDSSLLKMICAVALSAPSKSDLQQRDIIIVQDAGVRRALEMLMPSVDWLPKAPALLVVCGNNRRQRRLHELRGHAFANDHLDAFFNAAADAAILLAWLVAAAEAAGLGCCPISAIRNKAAEISCVLKLLKYVFPFAGMAVGWPSDEPALNPRLPLAATVHLDSFDDANLPEHVAETDRRRAIQKPFAHQRFHSEFKEMLDYSWSEDVTRQYSRLERETFGGYVRNQGFKLE